ncbi:MAG: acyl-CoA thioesterase [Gammaproteobacteria bacterium]|nr:MAG: acyl-CoA thioesterase [Gammaproteobacteria bacterium]
MDQTPFRHPFLPTLYDIDAAGVLFFGHLFRHLHDAYEAFMAEVGWPLPEIIAEGRFALPIVHTSADYLLPIRHGQALMVELAVTEIDESGFGIDYRIRDADNRLYATASTRHRCIAPEAQKRCPLPEALRRSLRHYSNSR